MDDYKNLYKSLDKAQAYADVYSTCTKVRVGSMIKPKKGTMLVYGTNHGIERNCRATGCLRVEKYGENAKVHRLPSDCASIHSEIHAISTAAQFGISLNGATIFVTRYPCESCARAIVSSGIETVVYGRSEEISEMTKSIFDSSNVSVKHIKDWQREDNNC